MTAHDQRVVSHIPEPFPGFRPVRRQLTGLAEKLARRFVIFTPSGPTVSALVAQARRRVKGIAELEVVNRVTSHNPDCMWAIARKERYCARDPVADGFVALLTLNREGLEQLLKAKFNALDPDIRLLSAQNEKPAAIYLWFVDARGPLSGAFALVLQKMTTPLTHDVDVYARAATADGRRLIEALDFRVETNPGTAGASPLYVFRRSDPAQRSEAPLYDSYKKCAGTGALAITVARTFEDLMRVVAIRGAVYLSEHRCPYDEEFDGNDQCAIHLLGYVGDEPAGCVRVRCFADFAKIERLAVRKEHRGTGLAVLLARASMEFCRAKGYGRLYGHSAKHMIDFWKKFGFKVVDGGREFAFSDFVYVAMILDAEPAPQAVTHTSDPYVILRPEGHWHRPGILERSAERLTSSPSITETTA